MEVVVEDENGIRRYRLPLEPEAEVGKNGQIDLRFLFKYYYHCRHPWERQPHVRFLGDFYPLPPIPRKGAEHLGQSERWDYNIANAVLVEGEERADGVVARSESGTPRL